LGDLGVTIGLFLFLFLFISPHLALIHSDAGRNIYFIASPKPAAAPPAATTQRRCWTGSIYL
jgi:hypothetical protein